MHLPRVAAHGHLQSSSQSHTLDGSHGGLSTTLQILANSFIDVVVNAAAAALLLELVDVEAGTEVVVGACEDDGFDGWVSMGTLCLLKE